MHHFVALETANTRGAIFSPHIFIRIFNGNSKLIYFKKTTDLIKFKRDISIFSKYTLKHGYFEHFIQKYI